MAFCHIDYSATPLEQFGLYSRVDRSLSSYQHLVDCYKEEFESINMASELPWVYGENLNESLAHNIYHRTTPLVCRDHKYSESKLQQRTLKITHLTEWNSWSVNEKIYYVGGYLDAGVTILQITNTSKSAKELERLKLNISRIWNVQDRWNFDWSFWKICRL